VETNLKSQLSSTLVANMALLKITYMEVATWEVKRALIDLKTTFTIKEDSNDNLSEPPPLVPTKLL
jgi:hypothetical protein